MAIADVAAYAHLSAADVEELGADLDAIRCDVEASLGAKDRAYIRRTIAFQRGLEAAARLTIAVSRGTLGWVLGTTALAAAKSIENMELGHNIGHGQWDWMNDPEIHSTSWEWDMAGASAHWRHSHNYRHHVFTNIIDMDHDLGFGVMRVTRDQRWRPSNLIQPVRSILLALLFEWGIALQGLHSTRQAASNAAERATRGRVLAAKITRQATKDYLFFPALSLWRWRRTLAANAVANLIRNVWAYVVICCGHFAEGAQTFTAAVLDSETKAEWYLRQLLGTANFHAGPVMAFMSGNLSYQIEHHLFPDLPSNRYAEISHRVQAVCARYGLPYTTGPLVRQYLGILATVCRLALPNGVARSTTVTAPGTGDGFGAAA
ncbi:fatty acid desaturase [Mycobacterium koreense]|uniref:Acyl-CoA desaturase n=1 Tax=Mycolicibacillus koreensis TaxID=1069220 RepID=A0A7I7SGJ7_9MYCO|nr:fatty acid desaturase [Mycolicibacillus koreensis]MCV7248179.1 fatty acid desaturase [Mycolicibacillus koreensis]OSC35713.1 acyl-CoA desaturase [Mycolicibacillus koreensis]BBY55115.1 fatty acid desaturase [Mycolicibacillus koreensis]